MACDEFGRVRIFWPVENLGSVKQVLPKDTEWDGGACGVKCHRGRAHLASCQHLSKASDSLSEWISPGF